MIELNARLANDGQLALEWSILGHYYLVPSLGFHPAFI